MIETALIVAAHGLIVLGLIVRGSSARLFADSNAAIDAMVESIDAAEQNVHLLFHLWLTDGNG